MICNPNNPTGYLYSKEEMETLRQIVLKHDILLISDEVYREFCYEDAIHHSALKLKGIEDHVILIDSASKRFSACGIRIGRMITKNKELPENVIIDMKIALITLKYTQSNSVCYVKDGQAIGIGAGQQSRVHCTRLAGMKADNWYLRQAPQVLGLQFLDTVGRADRDNAIDNYIGEEYMDVLAEGAWQKVFKVKPEVFTREEKRAWLDGMQDVTLGSDAFFPFSDNIERKNISFFSEMLYTKVMR